MTESTPQKSAEALVQDSLEIEGVTRAQIFDIIKALRPQLATSDWANRVRYLVSASNKPLSPADIQDLKGPAVIEDKKTLYDGLRMPHIAPNIAVKGIGGAQIYAKQGADHYNFMKTRITFQETVSSDNSEMAPYAQEHDGMYFYDEGNQQYEKFKIQDPEGNPVWVRGIKDFGRTEAAYYTSQDEPAYGDPDLIPCNQAVIVM